MQNQTVWDVGGDFNPNRSNPTRQVSPQIPWLCPHISHPGGSLGWAECAWVRGKWWEQGKSQTETFVLESRKKNL